MKILITRPRAQADDFAAKLHTAGFDPIFFPVIEIRPVENNTELETAFKNIQKYDWVVFTSVNAVDVVSNVLTSDPKQFPLLRIEERHPRNNGTVKIAAIGPKTTEALRKHGIEPDFVPEEYVAEAIMPGLGDLNGKRVLLPRAEIAREELPKAISKAGGAAHEIVVYRTLPAETDTNGLNALQSGVDVVTFTSASTVENFVAIARKNHLDPMNLPNQPLIACIGPITEQAAKEAGFQNLIVAKEYTTDGLIEILKHTEKL